MISIPFESPSPTKAAQDALRLLAERPDDPWIEYRLLRCFDPSERFDRYIHRLVRESDRYYLDIDLGSLGFIADYFWLSQYFVPRTGPATLVDVGCSSALQQVFFRPFDRYIGIDLIGGYQQNWHGRATFLTGEFADLVESGELVITPDMVGIANMSLLYGCPNRDRNLACFERFAKKAIR